jgi:hypothetical protein
MPDLAQQLDEAWHFLSTPGASSDMMPSRPIGVTTADGQVRVALDGDGIRHLLIPVSRRGDVVADRRSRGVVVVAQELEGDEGAQWFADLVCVEGRLSEVYHRLAEAVCDSVRSNPELAGSIPARILDMWRDMLSSPAAPLGREAVIGLYGELTVLLHGIEAAGASIFEKLGRSVWASP